MKNKKGQIFVSLIVFVLALIIFILAAPILYQVITENVGSMGSATGFFVKLFLWVIFLVMIALFLKIISSGEGFFTQ